VQLSDDVMWQRFLARVKRAALSAAGGQAVVTLRVLVVGGSPVLWAAPHVQRIEPGHGDSALDVLEKLCYSVDISE